MSVIALIPARGGSKGIARKNIRNFAGKPLIAWTIEAALACRCFDRVVVSTDDKEIAAISVSAGAELPFMRPDELATDTATSFAVAMHALEQLAEPVEALVLLQPTSPLRRADDIQAALGRVAETGAPSVVSVTRPDCHPNWLYRMRSDGKLDRYERRARIKRRQDLPPVYTPNGAIYYCRRNWLVATEDFVGVGTVGFEMPAERSIDIDTPSDWRLAELLLREERDAPSI